MPKATGLSIQWDAITGYIYILLTNTTMRGLVQIWGFTAKQEQTIQLLRVIPSNLHSI